MVSRGLIDRSVAEGVEEERKRIAAWLRDRARHTRSVKAQKALENAAEDLLRYAPAARGGLS